MIRPGAAAHLVLLPSVLHFCFGHGHVDRSREQATTLSALRTSPALDTASAQSPSFDLLPSIPPPIHPGTNRPIVASAPLNHMCVCASVM